VRDTSKGSHSRLKETWLRALQAGAGSLVVAAAVVAAPPAQAARLDTTTSVTDKVKEARESLRKSLLLPEGDQPSLDQLAWWGNRWGNGWGHRPNWHNWHNWHNWGNW
jgi:hypothetical protein